MAVVASFSERLTARMRATHSRICLGIDPRPERHPSTAPTTHGGDPAKVAKAVVGYFRTILEATHEQLACVKPQSAFFEALGIPGLIALAQLLADARELELPVILDAKRGDIGSTAEAYARAYLTDGVFAADALTVNPYLGGDALEPFVRTAAANERGLFVLVRTSNPGAADLQDLALQQGGTVAERVARLVTACNRGLLDAAGYGPVGAVVGATAKEGLAVLRAALPHSLLLLPGVGAQGAAAADTAAAFDRDGLGAVVSASRSLTYFGDDADVATSAREAVTALRNEVNAAVAAGR